MVLGALALLLPRVYCSSANVTDPCGRSTRITVQPEIRVAASLPALTDGTWIETILGKGGYVLLRVYSLRQPFLTKQ